MKRIAITLILFSVAQFAIAGGGWTQPKNIGFFKLSEWWIVADQHFTDTGKIDPNVTNGIFTTSLYAEYGLTNRWTVTAYLPFFSRVYNNNLVSANTGNVLTKGEGISGLGDPDIGITYGLIQNNHIALSATLQVGIPLGEDTGGSQENLQTGDGEFNQLFRVDAGKSFRLFNRNSYASANIGINNRTNGFSDEYRFGFEAGMDLIPNKLLLIIRFAGVQSLENGTENFRENSTSIFANNAEHFSYTPEINYFLNEKWGISAGVGGAFTGKLIYARPSYSFGIFYKMN